MFNFLKTLLNRYLSATYAFCLCMALTLGATYFAYRSSKIENAGRFDRTVTNMSNTLKSRMTVYMNALLYTRNLFEIKPDLTKDDFSNFVKGMQLKQYFPGIQTMGYVERLTRAQAQARLAKMNRTLEDADADPDSDEIDLVIFLEQLLENNAVVLGKDLGTSIERKQAMNAARDLGIPIATDRVQPLNTTDNSIYAFLVYIPRYRNGADISTIEARRKALLGFVYAGFRAPNLFGRISDDIRMRNADLATHVYDGVGADPARLMYSEGDFNKADSSLFRTIEFKAANHTWTMEIAAPKNFGLSYLQWSPLFVLALGTMLSLAVVASLLKSDLLSERLRIAREDADNANRAKSMFLANISHEIRTPLGVIIGFAESALAEDQKEQRDSYLKTILRNGNELGRIIGDVLDLSKIEAKTLLIDSNSFSLKKLNDDISEVWQTQAEAKGLQFIFDRSEELPEYIEADVTRVKQILVNLLSNAFKFTSQGSVRIKIKKTLETSSKSKKEEPKEFLSYVIDDTGIGIREENIKKLFKAFSQEDSSITRKFGGNGLGLAISKELAIALGGDIQVEANPNENGSRFTFKFPLIPSQSVAHKDAPTANNELVLKGKKILLVEDSVDNQVLIELIFKKYGVSISVANNGREGVNSALANLYDLILMDIQMPVLDGYAAFQELKAKNNKVPVIALTAHALKDERERALQLGFSAYLTKPIDRTQLIKVIAKVLS